MCLQINLQYFGLPCLYFTRIFVLAQVQDSVAGGGGGGGGHKQIGGGAGKLYFFEFECVDQKSVHCEIRQNLGNRPKKRSSSQKIRECPRILIYISKNVRIFSKSEVKTKNKRKKGLPPKIYANFYEFWGEITKINGLYCKVYEKTTLAHKFWGNNQYFGSLRPRIALQ